MSSRAASVRMRPEGANREILKDDADATCKASTARNDTVSTWRINSRAKSNARRLIQAYRKNLSTNCTVWRIYARPETGNAHLVCMRVRDGAIPFQHGKSVQYQLLITG